LLASFENEPMKLLVMLALITLTPALDQTPVAQEDSSLVVIKFDWTKYRENSGLISSLDDPGPTSNEPISMPRAPADNEPERVRNNRDLQERRADLRAGEKNAANSITRGSDFYLLRLELRNVGSNIVKSFIWEYQPLDETVDFRLRQYLCNTRARPNERKKFELVTLFSPAKVVSASEEKSKPEKYGKVVINKIEYSDGSVWQREGWSANVPSELPQKLRTGRCVAF
jgi:hypothetical protein